VGFSLGQTEYTPSDLLADTLQPGDRPYAGHLFVSGGWSVTYRRTIVATELMMGVTGPPSLAREAQSLAHWTWSSNSPKPLGWDHQLKTTVHVELVNQYLWHALEACRPKDGSRQCDGTYEENRFFDLSPRAELALGSLMTRVSGGAVARLGYRFPDALNVQRIPVTASGSERTSKQPWGMVFVMADGRLVGHNALLSGSPLVDGAPSGWRELKRIDTKHTLGEWAYGLAVGSRWASLVWQRAWRGAEYAPGGGSHKYGSIMLALHALGGA